MPLFLSEQHDHSTRLSVWKITESVDELVEILKPDQDEAAVYMAFRNETRKRHWLGTRILIRSLFADESVRIGYEDSGKPVMTYPPGYISISHSGCFAGVICDAEHPVGIDIEQFRPRIENVACKFLSKEEAEHITDSASRVQHLVTIWAAKEAMYKLMGKSDVEFDHDIRLGRFVPADRGTFTGIVKKHNKNGEMLFRYFLIDDYVLVWVK